MFLVSKADRLRYFRLAAIALDDPNSEVCKIMHREKLLDYATDHQRETIGAFVSGLLNEAEFINRMKTL
jgi:hypothetical protein